MAITRGNRFRLTRDYRGRGALLGPEGALIGEFGCVIPKGTVIMSTQDVNVMATGFNAVPWDYEGLERELVPEEDRLAEGYNGYTFMFFVGDIGALLETVET